MPSHALAKATCMCCLCLWNKENCLAREFHSLLIHRLYRVLCRSSRRGWPISARLWKSCPGKAQPRSARVTAPSWTWSWAAGRSSRHSWRSSARSWRSAWPNSRDSRFITIFLPLLIPGGLFLCDWGRTHLGACRN